MHPDTCQGTPISSLAALATQPFGGHGRFSRPRKGAYNQDLTPSRTYPSSVVSSCIKVPHIYPRVYLNRLYYNRTTEESPGNGDFVVGLGAADKTARVSPFLLFVTRRNTTCSLHPPSLHNSPHSSHRSTTRPRLATKNFYPMAFQRSE